MQFKISQKQARLKQISHSDSLNSPALEWRMRTRVLAPVSESEWILREGNGHFESGDFGVEGSDPPFFVCWKDFVIFGIFSKAAAGFWSIRFRGRFGVTFLDSKINVVEKRHKKLFFNHSCKFFRVFRSSFSWISDYKRSWRRSILFSGNIQIFKCSDFRREDPSFFKFLFFRFFILFFRQFSG